MRSRLAFLASLLLLLFADPALAITPDEMLANPKLEARARTIDKELRCLVCQNENIDESEAGLAHDLRLLVRKRIMAGNSDEQVKQYIVARYGNYVLLKPPFDAETYLLWLGPGILLLSAAGAATLYYRHAMLAADKRPLSEEEIRRLAALIADSDAGNKGA